MQASFFLIILCSSLATADPLQQSLLSYYNSIYRAIENEPNLQLAHYKPKFLAASRPCMMQKLNIEDQPNDDPKSFDDAAIENAYDKRFEVFRVAAMLCADNAIRGDFQATIDRDVNADYASKLDCFKRGLSEVEANSQLLADFYAIATADRAEECDDVLRVAFNNSRRDVQSTHEYYGEIYGLKVCKPEEFMPFDISRLMVLKFVLMANGKVSAGALKAEREIWVKNLTKYAEIQLECFMRELRNEYES
jgi:hypothetical protein